jgi:four helix bundle protein
MGRIVGDLKERTLRFAESALRAVSRFPNETRGWLVARQLARSASSVGANVWEADAALTDTEFAHKASIARREAAETEYWLELALRTGLLDKGNVADLRREAKELVRILATIVRKTQDHVRRTKG